MLNPTKNSENLFQASTIIGNIVASLLQFIFNILIIIEFKLKTGLSQVLKYACRLYSMLNPTKNLENLF